MRRISIAGVLVGGIVDFIVTNVLQNVLEFSVAATHHLADLPPGQIGTALEKIFSGDPMLRLVAWLLSAVGLVIAGFVAASIAKHDEPLNGALSAFIYLLGGVYAWVRAGDAHVGDILLLLSSLAIGALGGYLRMVQVRRRCPVSRNA